MTNSCKCGCGEKVKPGNRYVSGHNGRGISRSLKIRRKISATRKGLDTDKRDRRFLSKVSKTNIGKNCWLWTGGTNRDGYGVFTFQASMGKQKLVLAHRYVWERVYGPIPKGMEVMHDVCDNPPCVRLSHLKLGTHQENIDRRNKLGRTAHNYGERCGGAILTELKVKQVLKLLDSGQSKEDIAQRMGVCAGTISNIDKGKTWKHLTRNRVV